MPALDEFEGKIILDVFHRFFDATFWRFLVVGVLNTVFGYGVYCFGIMLNFSPEIASLVSNACGYAFNYMTVGRFVFRSRGWKTLPAFLAVAIIVYAVNASVLHILVAAETGKFLAQLLCLPLIVVLNYVLMKKFVFTDPQPHPLGDGRGHPLQKDLKNV